MSIIGDSDGLTAVFIAGKLGMDWLNVFGLVFGVGHVYVIYKNRIE